MDKAKVKVSVRNLVEFIERGGDIDTRIAASSDKEAMLAGGRAHRKLQKAMKDSYKAEVSLADEVEYDDLSIVVEGRADGIIEQDPPVIDEIKGIYRNPDSLLEPVPVHLSQAKCYAAILAKRDGLSAVDVRMTYVNLINEDIRYFNFHYTAEELFIWYERLLREYYKWAKDFSDRTRARDMSISHLEFPFVYRTGQRELVASVWHTIKEKQNLFIEAPTGVGKTMSVIFPAVRSMGEGRGDRIFYLTSKTVTGTVALDAFRILMEKGLHFKLSILTAKEKICPLSEPSCNPDDCPYAKGHFDRINDAVFELLHKTDVFDRGAILEEAQERKVCPFELSLDTALWTDAVICDYNYAFDPNARLRRFFGDNVRGDSILLVDEAHNLVERGRSMYSASLSKEHVLAAKKDLKGIHPPLVKLLEKLNRRLLLLKHSCEHTTVMDTAGDLILPLMQITEKMDDFFRNSPDPVLRKKLQDFYFEIRQFINTFDYVDDNYVTYSELTEEGEFLVHLFCVNPAANLSLITERVRATIFFSATLLPIAYYRQMLSGKEDDPAIYAESPFSQDQRVLLVARDVSTRYSSRGPSLYRKIARAIHDTAAAEKGNYLAFFPSYKMMNDVFDIYRNEFDEPGINWVVQTPSMREEDREMFLENFYEDPRQTLIGFSVMGGIFAEGIDLTGTRLIGAVVVGTGLPQIGHEKEILRNYYDSRGFDGFAYAYRIPGMNKVLQAAGRVIRTTSDHGVIVLLDDRFLTNEYRLLFPREWKNCRIIRADDVKEVLSQFWMCYNNNI